MSVPCYWYGDGSDDTYDPWCPPCAAAHEPFEMGYEVMDSGYAEEGTRCSWCTRVVTAGGLWKLPPCDLCELDGVGEPIVDVDRGQQAICEMCAGEFELLYTLRGIPVMKFLHGPVKP